MSSVNIKCDVFFRSEFWSDFVLCYSDSRYTDLAIVCGLDDDVANSTSISCHRLVMSAASEVFYTVLRERWRQEDPLEPEVVHLPDYKYEDVKEAVDNLYAFLSGRMNIETFLSPAERNPFYQLLSEKGIAKNRTPELSKRKALEDLADEKNKEAVKEQMMVDCLFPDSIFQPLHEGDGEFVLEDFESPDLDAKEDYKDFFENDKLRRKKGKSSSNATTMKKQALKYEEPDEDHLPLKRRRRDRKWKPKTLEQIQEGDQVGEEHQPCVVDRKMLYRSMTEATTNLRVRMLAEPLDVPLHCNKHHRTASAFQVLMGLRLPQSSAGSSTSFGNFDARPIAWSLPTSADITAQFDRAHAAFTAVFGFSEADICYNGLLFSRQGLFNKNKSKKVRYDLKRRYACLFKEQLLELLSSSAVSNAVRRYEPKPPFSISGDMESNLSMIPDLPMAELDSIALVSWNKETGEVTGRIMQVNHSDLEESSSHCLKCLFDVWCVARPLRIPENDYLCRKFNDLMEPMETYRIVQEFLNDDPDGQLRKNLLSKEKQCSECGKVFPCVTVQDEFRLNAHKRSHYYENFFCDCPEWPTFTNLSQKRNHVQLVHSNGKYEKCNRCNFVGTAFVVKKHQERDHKDSGANPDGGGAGSCVCETCGKVLNDSKALYMHMLIHKTYKCKQCGAEVVGYSAFQTHKKNAHPVGQPESYPCEVCGKTFPAKVKLKVHHLRMHVDDKDRPYQCNDCGRGFAVSRQLSAHRMMAHIKTRPYKCRYGCGAAYNDYSSRGTHERKKHGGTYPEKLKQST